MWLSKYGVVGMYSVSHFSPQWMEELLGQGLAIIDYHLSSVGSIWAPSVRREGRWLRRMAVPMAMPMHAHSVQPPKFIQMISQMPCIINETAERASDAAQ